MKNAGPSHLMLSSAEALRDIGYEVTFVSSGGPMVSSIENQGFEHIVIQGLDTEGRTLLGTVKASLRVLRLCRARRFSVVHAFNTHAALTALFPSRIIGAKLFNTVLGYGKERWLRYMPFHHVAVSKFVMDKLLECGVSKKRISVIYNSTLDDRFLVSDVLTLSALNRERSNLDVFTLVSVAIMIGDKGQDKVMESVKRYKELPGSQPIKVVFVGDGPKESELKAYALHLGLQKECEFVGLSQTVEQYLDASNCFIHLAGSETFGIVLAEAGARGLPVIASNVGGIPEVVIEGETGFLVDRDDITSVAYKIRQLAENSTLREELGKNGVQRSVTMFSRQVMGQELKRLYSHN